VVNVTPRKFYPLERPGTQCIGGWIGHRFGLDRCGKTPPTGIRSPCRQVSRKSLYRLSYRGHPHSCSKFFQDCSNCLSKFSASPPLICTFQCLCTIIHVYVYSSTCASIDRSCYLLNIICKRICCKEHSDMYRHA
jgi:hypothetical protein